MLFARLTYVQGSVEWMYMKTLSALFFATLFLLSGNQVASAQVYYTFENSYGNQVQNYPYQYPQYNQNSGSSYTYTTGCITYFYNGNTGVTSAVGNVCQNNNYTQIITQPQVTYYTEPQVSYITQPQQITYITQPQTTYSLQQNVVANPYTTYQYQNNTWYSPYTTQYVSPNYLCFSIIGIQGCF
jgi:hypothetical protein